MNYAAAESPEHGGDGGAAHCHQVSTRALQRFCDMASLSRHSAKLSASLPVSGRWLSPKAKRDHPNRKLFTPSVLWRCWLGGKKGIQPVKNMGVVGVGASLVRMGCRPLRLPVPLPPLSPLAPQKSRRMMA